MDKAEKLFLKNVEEHDMDFGVFYDYIKCRIMMHPL